MRLHGWNRSVRRIPLACTSGSHTWVIHRRARSTTGTGRTASADTPDLTCGIDPGSPKAARFGGPPRFRPPRAEPLAARSRARSASTSRFRGARRRDERGEQRVDAAVTSSTARSNAASFAFDGFVRTADLAHVLQRGRAHLLLGRGRLVVVERLDVPAHPGNLASAALPRLPAWQAWSAGRPSSVHWTRFSAATARSPVRPSSPARPGSARRRSGTPASSSTRARGPPGARGQTGRERAGAAVRGTRGSARNRVATRRSGRLARAAVRRRSTPRSHARRRAGPSISTRCREACWSSCAAAPARTACSWRSTTSSGSIVRQRRRSSSPSAGCGRRRCASSSRRVPRPRRPPPAARARRLGPGAATRRDRPTLGGRAGERACVRARHAPLPAAARDARERLGRQPHVRRRARACRLARPRDGDAPTDPAPGPRGQDRRARPGRPAAP